MDWSNLFLSMVHKEPAYQPAPIQVQQPTSPWVWALFGVGAVVLIGGLAVALRK